MLVPWLLKSKKPIKTWPGPKYKCSVCKWEWNFLLNMIFIMHNILQRWIQGAVRHLRWNYLWKKINDLKPLKAVIAKRSILGIWRGSEYVSAFSKLYIWKRGVFSNFWSIFFYFFNISVRFCFLSFLHLNCCKLFKVFNPRINKAIIILQ